MIFIKQSDIKSIKHGNLGVNQIFNKQLLLWSSIQSCFGAGTWLDNYPWSDNDIWADQ